MKNYSSNKPCICCGIIGSDIVCYHHIYSKKAFPQYKTEKWNLLSCCLKHHNQIHNSGLVKISDNFPNVKKWLINNEWYRCEISGKWVHKLEYNNGRV